MKIELVKMIILYITALKKRLISRIQYFWKSFALKHETNCTESSNSHRRSQGGGPGGAGPPNQNSTNDKNLWQHSLAMFKTFEFPISAEKSFNFGEDLFFFFWRPPDFGRKKRSNFRKITLNFGEDLFFIFIFLFLETTWFWAEKTFEFPKNHSQFRWRHPNFWGFVLKIPPPKFSRSATGMAPPPIKNPGNAYGISYIVFSFTFHLKHIVKFFVYEIYSLKRQVKRLSTFFEKNVVIKTKEFFCWLRTFHKANFDFNIK